MSGGTLGTLIGGIILLAVAAWILATGTDTTFRFPGAAILGILGIAVLWTGITRMKQTG